MSAKFCFVEFGVKISFIGISEADYGEGFVLLLCEEMSLSEDFDF